MNMALEILTRQPIKFYEKQGIKFFEPFNAVDKFKKPVKLFFDETEELTTLTAENHQKNNPYMVCNLILQKEKCKGLL